MDPSGHNYCPSSEGSCDPGPQTPPYTPPPLNPADVADPCDEDNCLPRELAAYNVYSELLIQLNRMSLTYQEILAFLISAEIGLVEGQDPVGFNYALEGLGRQFYNMCGSDGNCEGTEIWEFLGTMQGWYQGDVLEHTEAYKWYLDDAEEILSNESWQNGIVGHRPYHYGNGSLYDGSTMAAVNASKSFTACVKGTMDCADYQLGYYVKYNPTDFYVYTYDQWWALQVYTSDNFTVQN
jgi:hypothetical protein